MTTASTFASTPRVAGPAIRDEGYYRQWPKPITPAEEQNNGFIRGLTRREELAAFAAARGNCLFDNFRFLASVEAFYLAYKIAPHKYSLHDAWSLAAYSTKVWTILRNLAEEQQDTSIEQAICRVAEKLRGQNTGIFRQHAIENILRIIRNRRRPERAATHAAAFPRLAAT